MGPTLNPAKLFVDGFDWNGRTNRRQLWLVVILANLPLLAISIVHEFGTLAVLLRSALILSYAVCVVPLVGHVLRRINDLGWSGWAIWLVFIPYFGVLAFIVLLLRGRGYRTPLSTTFWRLFGLFGAIMFAVLIASRIFWTPFFLTSGDMKPNFLAGDYVIGGVLRVEFEAGDLVFVKHPRTGVPILRRVIATAGDTVHLQSGNLTLNGKAAQLVSDGFFDERMEPQGPLGLLPRCSNGAVGQLATCRKARQIETLPNGASYRILDIGRTALDQTEPVTVPQGYVYVLGDNRDSALDSRIATGAGGLGMLPVENIIGRAWFVLYSVSSKTPWSLWALRPDRIFKGIE